MTIIIPLAFVAIIIIICTEPLLLNPTYLKIKPFLQLIQQPKRH